MVASKKKKPVKKASGAAPKVNPFELKFNRLKHNVLGKKTAIAGRPGVSKKRAFAEREKTLGAEHSRIGVVNKIIDKRIGEKDATKSAEEKASMRFVAERSKGMKKGNIFNLSDDVDHEEKLTHGGSVLSSVGKYDKTIASDDDDDDDGAIGANIVRTAHFGGGEEVTERKEHQLGGRKDLIAELIAKTKQARYEKLTAKEDMETVTDNLDEKYKRLMGKMGNAFRAVGATKTEKKETDDYDKIMMGLKLDADARATPADPKKTEKERAAEEKERLAELERRRVARMNAENNKKSSHLSTDADIQGNAINEKKKKKAQGFEVRFDESGKMINKDKVEKTSIKKIAIDSDDEISDEEEDDDEDLDDLIGKDDEDEDEDQEDNNDAGDPEPEVEDEEEEDVEDEDDDEEEDEEDEIEEQEKVVKKTVKQIPKDILDISPEDLDVPFTFSMPKKYEDFRDLIQKYGFQKGGVVIERLIKCYHPSLKEGNKLLLNKLFLLVLRFYNELAEEVPTSENVKFLGELSVQLYSLMKFDVDYSVRCLRAVLRSLWKVRNETKKYSPPSFSLIAILRLIETLYPVSDAYHPVCSPAFILAARTLATVQVASLSTLVRQLILVSNITEYIADSKRYVPELIAFLQGALLMAVDSGDKERTPSNVFPISLPHRTMLLIDKPVTAEVETTPLKLEAIFSDDDNSLDDSVANRLSVVRSLIAIIQKISPLYSIHEQAYTAIFTPFLRLLKRLPTSNYPSVLQEEVEALTTSMESECQRHSRMVQLSQVKTEKSMIKMLEPVFEEDFNPERRRHAFSKGEMGEKSKLKYLLKKESRGAMKELRKDAAFLGRKQRQEIEAKDRDRRQKTKRLLQSLSSQQGEWNQEKYEAGKDKKRKNH